MKKNSANGFTLIELLVVIAIIGILASVVLASLNSARSKGADASIKANLSNGRAAAELVYDGANSYATVCNTGIGARPMVDAAATASGGAGATVTVNNATAQTTGTTCNASATAWAASVPLKAGGYYCVDNTGDAMATSTPLGATADTLCN